MVLAQTIALPVEDLPVAPSGEQNAPGVTKFSRVVGAAVVVGAVVGAAVVIAAVVGGAVVVDTSVVEVAAVVVVDGADEEATGGVVLVDVDPTEVVVEATV